MTLRLTTVLRSALAAHPTQRLDAEYWTASLDQRALADKQASKEDDHDRDRPDRDR